MNEKGEWKKNRRMNENERGRRRVEIGIKNGKWRDKEKI